MLIVYEYDFRFLIILFYSILVQRIYKNYFCILLLYLILSDIQFYYYLDTNNISAHNLLQSYP